MKSREWFSSGFQPRLHGDFNCHVHGGRTSKRSIQADWRRRDHGFTQASHTVGRAQSETMPVSPTVVSMACPKCKDTWVAQADTNPKGLGARTLMGQTTKRVAQHLCEGCGSEWTTAGNEKAKHAVATHTCSGCGAGNLACCSTKGSGDVATKGMGQKIQIAAQVAAGSEKQSSAGQT
jgi:hypothetical protein